MIPFAERLASGLRLLKISVEARLVYKAQLAGAAPLPRMTLSNA